MQVEEIVIDIMTLKRAVQDAPFTDYTIVKQLIEKTSTKMDLK